MNATRSQNSVNGGLQKTLVARKRNISGTRTSVRAWTNQNFNRSEERGYMPLSG